MTGLTPFLCALLKADRATLAKADPAKLAAKYSIKPEWARFYIGHWRAAA